MNEERIAEIKEIFTDLVKLDSPSGEEGEVRDYLIRLFQGIGVVLEKDETGNLFGKIKGKGEAVLLSAHMDTVDPARGKKPVFSQDGTIRSDGSTVLGADDISGLVEIYETAKAVMEMDEEDHLPLEILFSVQEEIYAQGAAQFDYSRVSARKALVLDMSGPIGRAAYAAPSILSFEATINGKAAHAGFCPEAGINAIMASALAVSRLPIGRVGEGLTGNVGTIDGGSGKNIVPGEVSVQGEVRGYIHEEAIGLLDRYRAVFEEETAKVGGSLTWTQTEHIRGYETDIQLSGLDEIFSKAARAVGLTPSFVKTFGGSDNNVFVQKGIAGIVLASSMNQVHSTGEYTNLYEMDTMAELLIRLVSDI